jgi:hypothetical protein
VLSFPTEKLNERAAKYSMSFAARVLLRAMPKKEADGRFWHTCDVPQWGIESLLSAE